MDEAIALSKEVGEKVAALYRVPVFLYEKSASAPHRENLAAIRKGEVEGMEAKIKQPESIGRDSGDRRPYAAGGL